MAEIFACLSGVETSTFASNGGAGQLAISKRRELTGGTGPKDGILVTAADAAAAAVGGLLGRRGSKGEKECNNV